MTMVDEELTSVAILDDYQGVALRSADWSRVKERAEVTSIPQPLAGQDEAAELLGSYEIICAMRERTRFDAELLDRLPRLRLLVTTGSANRSIDLDAAARNEVVVSSTTNGAGRLATAELTMALILACARRLPQEREAIADGLWQGGMGRLLHGATLGILGLGGVGRHVARLGRAFGMDVLAWSPNLTPERALDGLAESASFDQLLSTSDFVSIHLAGTPETRHMVDATTLALMNRSAYLINTSRGSIVDEAALCQALEANWIAGVGLDVFEREPLPADHPLLRLPNAILTPHLGYVTEEVYSDFFDDTVAAVLAFLDGRPQSVLTAGADRG
jgi:phosphoglycerate dehydrogenase-like enzyme